MGGGKSSGGSTVSATPSAASMQANSNMLEAYMSNMSNSNALMLQQMKALQDQSLQNQVPVTEATTPVDWTEVQNKIASKSKADYALEQARKVGRSDTILTSPLLDDQEAETTSNSLIGS